MPDDVRADFTSANTAAPAEVIQLWPDGPPSTLPGVGPEIVFRGPAAGGVDTDMLRNVSDPTLTVFRPAPSKANGTGVIVCPGGGWRILAWEHEGVDLARWLAAAGCTAFLLKYRLMATPADPAEFALSMGKMLTRSWENAPAAECPRSIADLTSDTAALDQARAVAADDGRRAVALVRERAAEWGLQPDKVGVIGFSAGAFLAADIAVEPRAPALAFVAPIYGGETSGRAVPADAPPLFTVIAQDDRILFKVVEGLYADWSNADRPSELHIFNRGGHGFGMVRRGLPVDRWIDLLGDWLADRGFVARG